MPPTQHRIIVPTTLKRETIHELLAQTMRPDGEPVSKNVFLSLETIRFIEPVGVTVLANLIEWFDVKGCKGMIGGFESRSAKVIRYLDEIGFFELYWKERLYADSAPRRTMLPLAQVQYERSTDYIRNTFVPWATRAMNCSVGAVGPIEVGLGEIFDNIRYHAGVVRGCVCGQYYPNRHVLVIAISDFGHGIPHTMRPLYLSLDDGELIREATKHGVTSLSETSRRGAGLDNLIRNAILGVGGTVTIRSGKGLVRCNIMQSDDVRVIRRYAELSAYYPGTLFEIVLRTGAIAESPTETLIWEL